MKSIIIITYNSSAYIKKCLDRCSALLLMLPFFWRKVSRSFFTRHIKANTSSTPEAEERLRTKYISTQNPPAMPIAEAAGVKPWMPPIMPP